VLQTPTPDNPFAGGSPCVSVGDILAPFGPSGAPSCTVERGTKIFVTVWSTECSTFEGNGPTEDALRACARAADAGITEHTVTVDGQPVPVGEAETDLLRIHLPKDNIFGLAAGPVSNGLSVGHGWAALLDALPPGTHTIHIHVGGTLTSDVTTTIVVE
jgi:hypothetical protein